MKLIDYFLIPQNVLVITEVFLFLSLFISSLQHLANIEEFSGYGLFSWDLLQGTYYGLPRSKLINAIFSKRGFALLNIGRLFLLGYCFCTVGNLSGLVVWALLICNLLIYYRTIVTINGADQMNSIIVVLLVLAVCLKDTRLKEVIILFLAAHLILCYFTSGLLKVLEANWRRGDALRGILQTRTYSIPVVSKRAASASGGFMKALSLCTIIWELSFLYTPFMNFYVLLAFLITGVVFHLFNAVVMGLNSFLFTFLGLYGCILFTNLYLGAHLFH
jgi:hypothetical protein